MHRDHEQDADRVPRRVSLLPCVIHVYSTPVSRASARKLLVDELLAADDADLCQAKPLRRNHYDGDDFVLDGELTLKGVTLPVPLKLEVNGFGPDPFAPDPMAGGRAGFTATGEINRIDFGVSYNGPIPGGGVALGEKVQLVLEIEAALVP